MSPNLPTFTAIRGLIARRILINYRVDPDVLQQHLPPVFRPKRVGNFGIAGICLIRLERMRPAVLSPMWAGLASENAAHRIAVEWDEGGRTREGVYIPIRHTDSRWTARMGRQWCGHRQWTRPFWTAESRHRIKVEVRDGMERPYIRVAARLDGWSMGGSVFKAVDEASRFFRSGSIGWSPHPDSLALSRVELIANRWELLPLRVEHLVSAWFEEPDRFPKGTITFDSAFLMRNIEHEWRVLPPLDGDTRRREAA